MDISRLPLPVQNVLEKLLLTHDVNVFNKFTFSPNLLQAILLVVLIFFLIYTMGHVRHTYVDWSVKGIIPGVSFGFILAIILEGLLLVGGKTIITEVVGWKDAPKPISNALDAGRNGLVNVLGVSSQIPQSSASEKPTLQKIRQDIQSLNDTEQNSLRDLFCTK